MENIMKVVNASTNNKGQTHYILYPENIYELHDDVEGCRIHYGNGSNALFVENAKARQIKRSIQEQLEQPLGYLKTEYEYMKGHIGLRYFNVDHIAVIISQNPIQNEKNETVEVCAIVLEKGGTIKIYHPAHEVAYQIRRVMKRLDQDAEICCAPKAEQESEE